MTDAENVLIPRSKYFCVDLYQHRYTKWVEWQTARQPGNIVFYFWSNSWPMTYFLPTLWPLTYILTVDSPYHTESVTHCHTWLSPTFRPRVTHVSFTFHPRVTDVSLMCYPGFTHDCHPFSPMCHKLSPIVTHVSLTVTHCHPLLPTVTHVSPTVTHVSPRCRSLSNFYTSHVTWLLVRT